MVTTLLWWSVDTIVVIIGVCSCSCGGCLHCLVADGESLTCFKEENGHLAVSARDPYLGYGYPSLVKSLTRHNVIPILFLDLVHINLKTDHI